MSQTPDVVERLVSFVFDHHNAMAQRGERYEVRAMEDGSAHVVIDKGFATEKEFYLDDCVIFNELLEVVRTYGMDKYENDYQPDVEIFDGDSWNLYYRYDSGRSISSGGYMAWPDNYREARRALSDCFQKWRNYGE